MMDKSRLIAIDNLRGIAMLLVLIGHSIQFSNGQEFLANGDFYENLPFRIIYGFHMPVFMAISGFLFVKSVEYRSARAIIWGRITGILMPIFVWGTIEWCYRTLVIRAVISTTTIGLVKGWTSYCMHNLWFLWAIFYSSIIVVVVEKFTKQKVLIYSLAGICMLFTPDTFGFGNFKYMYPFFILPFILRFKLMEWDFLGCDLRKMANLSILFVFVYSIIMHYWQRENYIYISGFSLLGKSFIHQCVLDAVRIVAGVSGIFLFIVGYRMMLVFMPCAVNNPIIYTLSKNSLGVYIVSGLAYSYVVPSVTRNFTFSWLGVLACTIIVLIVSVIASSILAEYRLLSVMLLGGRKKK